MSYYGQPAVNDDGFEGQDSLLLDLSIPANGTYYLEVDTFANTDRGNYEAFIYSFQALGTDRLGGAGDTLIGGAGPDALIGSTGDDQFVGDLNEDLFIGYTLTDVAGVTNTSPVATPTSIRWTRTGF